MNVVPYRHYGHFVTPMRRYNCRVTRNLKSFISQMNLTYVVDADIEKSIAAEYLVVHQVLPSCPRCILIRIAPPDIRHQDNFETGQMLFLECPHQNLSSNTSQFIIEISATEHFYFF